MDAHKHAIKDFDLQLEMNDLQIDMITDKDEIIPYEEERYSRLEEKKYNLLKGKRYHQNASHAYWYWLEREKMNK